MKTAGNNQRHSAACLTLEKDSFLPPAVNHEDPLILELFEYAENWARRFYRIRQSHDVDVGYISDFMSRILLPNSNAFSSHTLAEQIHEFIMTRLHQGVTLKDVSQHFGYSQKHCSNVFRSHMGKSFTVYVKRIRLHTAKRLLQNSDRTIGDVAQTVGFQNQFSFSHFFKKETGLSPRHFRNAVSLGSRT